jgi:DNA-binding YbaB/EbfC family protein
MLKGLGDMGGMMKKAMSMQKELKKVQKELKRITVESEVGGGMLKVTANGAMEIMDVKIDKAKMDLNDVSMLEDLVISGVNEALRKAKDLAKEKMSSVTGGLNLPGMDGLMQ